LLVGDLNTIAPSDLLKRLSLSGRLAGVVGGPPCQGFSSIGKRRADDPRNQLLRRFFHFVEGLKPKFFFMENVPGLLLDDGPALLSSAISELKFPYRVLEPIILNAGDFGSATTRRRLVVFGYDPNEVDELTLNDFVAAKSTKVYTVKDALGDLPGPTATGWAKLDPSREASDYAVGLNAGIPFGLGNNLHLEAFRSGSVSGFQNTAHSSDVVERFSTVSPGSKDLVSRYVRLVWGKPSNVLRAGTGADRGSFQAARPIHPQEHRVITVREAARIQGFPDWYAFHDTKWHSHRMIGNSVSPPFARALLSVVAARMPMAEQTSL
jgi:DNA (cytosine-5)-methyltransferase 1